jgi:hypothetical protein
MKPRRTVIRKKITAWDLDYYPRKNKKYGVVQVQTV